MAIGSSTGPRRQASSQGRTQTRPMVAGMGQRRTHGVCRAIDVVDAQLLHIGGDVDACGAGGHAGCHHGRRVGAAGETGFAGDDGPFETLRVALERLEHPRAAGASQVAARRLGDVASERTRPLQSIRGPAPAGADLIDVTQEYLVHADAAREALPAALGHDAGGELPGEVDDVDRLVPQGHPAPAHNAPE